MFSRSGGYGKRSIRATRRWSLSDMQNDFIADEGLIAREGRDVSQAKEMAEHLPKLIKTARAAGVFVVFVRNVYTSEQNFYLSDVWLEQAARKRAGGYTRIPVCAAGFLGRRFLRRCPAGAERSDRH
jgi:nicotinamidase-related amidase